MEALLARYPFFEQARAAVEDEGVDIQTLVQDEPAVIERAVDRLIAAIDSGDTGERDRSHRIELLSYPVARIILSIIDRPRLTRTVAAAEAATAIERIKHDVESTTHLRSSSYEPPTLDRFLREFGLETAVVRIEDGRDRIHVGAYLAYTTDRGHPKWRLVNRALADGEIYLARDELFDILEGAITARVQENLPLAVPEPIRANLEAAVDQVEADLGGHEYEVDFEGTYPALFPPCMQALIERARKGESLPPHSRFAIVGFLSAVGFDSDAICDFLEIEDSQDRSFYAHTVAHTKSEGGPLEYAPPSCTTMQAYGDCVNMDERCERIAHPLGYYEQALSEEATEDLTEYDGQSA